MERHVIDGGQPLLPCVHTLSNSVTREKQRDTCREKSHKLMRWMSGSTHRQSNTPMISLSNCVIIIILLCSTHTAALILFIHGVKLDSYLSYVALFSFSASEADEISFNRGDIIKVTEMEDDSCWFTAEIQGKRSFIPANFISLLPHRWFAGQVSRLEAEQCLRWQNTGVFLVRESESAPGEFSLSVSYGDRVEHFRVLQRGGQYFIWDKSFCSLNRLVDFYRTHSIALEKVICLRDPPLSQHLLSHPGCNPYPNPYKISSQETLPSPCLYPHPSHPKRETSSNLMEAVSEKPPLAQALCDYNPPQTTHLHFLRGDIIDQLDCSGSPTWRGRCRGRVGIFPPEYVQLLYH